MLYIVFCFWYSNCNWTNCVEEAGDDENMKCLHKWYWHLTHQSSIKSSASGYIFIYSVITDCLLLCLLKSKSKVKWNQKRMAFKNFIHVYFSLILQLLLCCELWGLFGETLDNGQVWVCIQSSTPGSTHTSTIKYYTL